MTLQRSSYRSGVRRLAYVVVISGTLFLAWRRTSQDVGPLTRSWRSLQGRLASGTLETSGPTQAPRPSAAEQRAADPTTFLASRRGRVTLLYFWSHQSERSTSWLPQIGIVHDTYAAAGLEVVGVVLQPPAEATAGYLESRGIDWPQLEAPALAQALARQLTAHPGVLVLLDRSGATESFAPSLNVENRIVEALGLDDRIAAVPVESGSVTGRVLYGGRALPGVLARRAVTTVRSAWDYSPPPSEHGQHFEVATARYTLSNLPVGTWTFSVAIGDCRVTPHDCYSASKRFAVFPGSRLVSDTIELERQIHLIAPAETHRGDLSPTELLEHPSPVRFEWSAAPAFDPYDYRYAYQVHALASRHRVVAEGATHATELTLELPPGATYRLVLFAFAGEHRIGVLRSRRERFGYQHYDFAVPGPANVGEAPRGAEADSRPGITTSAGASSSRPP